ncbi:hypothetical protein PAXRUDRAFT_26015, partial [Paxillus rubicundulus Ve08.2h10]
MAPSHKSDCTKRPTEKAAAMMAQPRTKARACPPKTKKQSPKQKGKKCQHASSEESTASEGTSDAAESKGYVENIPKPQRNKPPLKCSHHTFLASKPEDEEIDVLAPEGDNVIEVATGSSSVAAEKEVTGSENE